MNNTHKRHEYLEVAGRGSTGIVYRVFNYQRGHQTAIKLQRAKPECEREILFAQRLSGVEGFVSLYDCWEEERYNPSAKRYTLMEMECAYESLSDLFSRPGSSEEIPLEERYSLLFEIVFALNKAFTEFGFCHGDLKLSNILYKKNQPPRTYLIEQGSLKIQSPLRPLITDFGHSYSVSGGRKEVILIPMEELWGLNSLMDTLFALPSRVIDSRILFGECNYDSLLGALSGTLCAM